MEGAGTASEEVEEGWTGLVEAGRWSGVFSGTSGEGEGDCFGWLGVKDGSRVGDPDLPSDGDRGVASVGEVFEAVLTSLGVGSVLIVSCLRLCLGGGGLRKDGRFGAGLDTGSDEGAGSGCFVGVASPGCVLWS